MTEQNDSKVDWNIKAAYAARCDALLEKFFAGDKDKMKAWIFTPNLMLGGVSPSFMLVTGRGEQLYNFIKEQMAENDV